MTLWDQGGGRGPQGPMYDWGRVRNTPNAGRNYGMLRGGPVDRNPSGPGQWQWSSHGPDAWNDYGWEYRGGTRRQSTVVRTGADEGRGVQGGRRMEEQRSGGLPRGRGRFSLGSLEQHDRRGARWIRRGLSTGRLHAGRLRYADATRWRVRKRLCGSPAARLPAVTACAGDLLRVRDSPRRDPTSPVLAGRTLAHRSPANLTMRSVGVYPLPAGTLRWQPKGCDPIQIKSGESSYPGPEPFRFETTS